MTQQRRFSAENAAQHSVQKSNGNVVLGCGPKSCHAHEQAAEQNRDEESDVRLGCEFDFQTCLSHCRLETVESVATPMVADVVLDAPKKHERRHEKQRATAWP